MDHGGAQGLVHELVHWASALVLVVGGGVALVAMALARRRAPSPAGPVRGATGSDAPDRSFLVILAGLSLGAAAIHLVAAPGHYVELGDLGAGFLVAAVLQAAWARSILRGGAGRAIAAGLAINGVILTLWVVSRTAGLPVGPTPGVAEPVGLPDGAAAVFEGLLIAGLLVRATGADRRITLRFPAVRVLVPVAVVPVLGLVLLMSSLATLAIGAGAEHGLPRGAHGMSDSAPQVRIDDSRRDFDPS